MLTRLSLLLLLFTCTARALQLSAGSLRPQDDVVAHDRVYKDSTPFGSSTAVYSRTFNCLISYINVEDRWGVPPGPKVDMVRGGLNHRHVTIKFTSTYQTSIYMNVDIACANVDLKPKNDTAPVTPKSTTTKSPA